MTIQPLTVTLAKPPVSEKQQAYLDDILAQATEQLQALSEHAPQSCEHVAAKWQDMLAVEKTWFADTVITTLRDHDWLMEVYRTAERTLRNKTEKEALKSLVAEKMRR